MPTGFKGFDTIEDLQAAIANAPAVEVIGDEVDETVDLLKTAWVEFCNSRHNNGSVKHEAAEYVMRLVCEALEVDYDEVVKHAHTNAD